jgi:hypothetical protein
MSSKKAKCQVADFLSIVSANASRISRKQYNQELNDAINQIEKGNGVSHTVAEKELSKR